jgi:hypothetical protein
MIYRKPARLFLVGCAKEIGVASSLFGMPELFLCVLVCCTVVWYALCS